MKYVMKSFGKAFGAVTGICVGFTVCGYFLNLIAPKSIEFEYEEEVEEDLEAEADDLA